MATTGDVRELALSFPETMERLSYGTPAFFVKGRLFARLKEDGITVMLRMHVDQKDFFLAAWPERYYTTPHYDGYPAVLAWLERMDRQELRDRLTDAWRLVAPKRLLAAWDAVDHREPGAE